MIKPTAIRGTLLKLLAPASVISFFMSCSKMPDLLPQSEQGQIISYTLLENYSMGQLDSLFALDGLTVFPVHYAVNMYKIVYKTIDADGVETQASGAVCIPLDTVDAFPLASYQHGTVFRKDDVPSRENYESLLGLIYAPGGYVICMPDYLGLGDSPGLHPYCHAKTEASAILDMLRATRQLCSILHIQLNDQLFLFGYSQGGHATMAAAKDIQENHADEFQITAAAPMSGPYDMDGAQEAYVTSDEPYDAPEYLPYLMLAYNSVYKLYPRYSDFLNPPYDKTLPPLFDGTHDGSEIAASLPAEPKYIVRPDVLHDFLSNPDNPFRKALSDNDLTGWAPAMPMTLYYCGEDELVNYQNAINAFNAFIQNGSTSVSLYEPDPHGTHESCASPSLFYSRIWFDTLKH